MARSPALDVLFGQNHGVLADPNFQLTLLANLAAPLGTALVSPLLDSLTTPFGVSSTNVGLMITTFTAPGIFIIPLSGFLTDYYGRKPVLLFGLPLSGPAGTAIAFTTDFRVALGLRALQGAGLAGITPVLITSIGDMYDGERETTGQGIRFGVSGLTTAVFPVLAGFLVVVAWQYPFLLYGIAIPIAAVVYFRFDEPLAASGTSPDRPTETPAESTDDERYLSKMGDVIARVHVVSFLVVRAVPVVLYIGFLTYNSIGVLVAALEFSGAVQWTLTGVGLVGVSAGVASVLVMTATTPRSVYSST